MAANLKVGWSNLKAAQIMSQTNLIYQYYNLDGMTHQRYHPVCHSRHVFDKVVTCDKLQEKDGSWRVVGGRVKALYTSS